MSAHASLVQGPRLFDHVPQAENVWCPLAASCGVEVNIAHLLVGDTVTGCLLRNMIWSRPCGGVVVRRFIWPCPCTDFQTRVHFWTRLSGRRHDAWSMRNVKSTSPITENGHENCIYSMNNIHKSNEDNKHDTNYINKYNDANTDTRKLHL